jgi:hypothetical protein
MPLRERKQVTPLVEDWLIRQGYYLKVKEDGRKGVDIQAEKEGQLWVVETKGYQVQKNAWRPTFFTGLGQLAIARSRFPESTWISLALSSDEQYVSYVQQYKDVFPFLRASVIWVHDKDHIYHVDPQSPQFPCPHCGERIESVRRICTEEQLWREVLVCPHCKRPLRC